MGILAAFFVCVGAHGQSGPAGLSEVFDSVARRLNELGERAEDFITPRLGPLWNLEDGEFQGAVTQVREFVENCPVQPSAMVSVSNEFGEVRIKTWDNQVVQVRAEIAAAAESAELALQIALETAIRVSPSQDFVEVQTEYPDTRMMGYVRKEVNYVITVPQNANVLCANDFGDTIVLGVGGAGPFSAVFTPDFSRLLWCSVIAMCDHADMRACGDGVAAVSVCRGDDTGDGRTPSFVQYDISDWPGFLTAIRDGAASGKACPSKRLWSFFSRGLKMSILAHTPGEQPSIALKKRFYHELNYILVNCPKLHDEESWQGCSFDAREQRMIEKARGEGIGKKELKVLNRRLIEKGFPEHVFAAPKSNRPPVLEAVQPDFGGGYCDGHLYLLKPPQ